MYWAFFAVHLCRRCLIFDQIQVVHSNLQADSLPGLNRRETILRIELKNAKLDQIQKTGKISGHLQGEENEIKTLTLTAVIALGVSAAFAEEVRVYNWSDYIDEDLLKKFEEETGLTLIYDVFDSNEVLETKMLAGGSGYDVVVPSGTFLQRQIQAGAFQELDTVQACPMPETFGTSSRNAPPGYDPEQRLFDQLHVGHDGDWRECRQGQGSAGRRCGAEQHGSGSEAGEHGEACLMRRAFPGCTVRDHSRWRCSTLGEDPDSHDTGRDRQGRRSVLTAVRPHIQKFHSSEYINALANGDICVAVGWSGDILQARDRAAEADNGVRSNTTRLPKAR